MQKKSSIPRIVIVGGGAGGLELATRLGNTLGRKRKAEIILVDNAMTHLWKPLLHEVAAGTLDSHEDEISYLAHSYNHYLKFIYGEFVGLDRQKQTVLLAPVLDEQQQQIIPAREISYDKLIIAVGSVSHDYATPGVSKQGLFLDSRAQAETIQRRLLHHLIRVSQSQEKQLGLAIAVVGGGATGVELIAEISYAVRQAMQLGLEKINAMQQVKFTLIEAAPEILANLPQRVIDKVRKQLAQLNVDVYTRQKVTEVTAQGVAAQSGLFIPADLVIWAAGIKAPEFLRNLDGLEVNRLNQLLVKQTLQTTQDANVFAFGDCASCPQPGKNTPVPPRAQAAHQQAKLLAKSLMRQLRGENLLPYHYRDYGSLVSLSRYNTVGNLMGRILGNWMIEGMLAKLVYHSLYKMHQITVFGWWRVILMIMANLLTRRVRPQIKLH